MADIFDVVADSTRRDILAVLRQRRSADTDRLGEISVGEIVSTLGLSQPTVSKHLKVLREAGLVNVREEGQHRYYRLDKHPLEGLADWLNPFLDDPAPEVASAPLDELGKGPRSFAAAIGRSFASVAHRTVDALRGSR